MKGGVKLTPQKILPSKSPTLWVTKFKRRNFYAIFKDNIWAAELAEMETLSS